MAQWIAHWTSRLPGEAIQRLCVRVPPESTFWLFVDLYIAHCCPQAKESCELSLKLSSPWTVGTTAGFRTTPQLLQKKAGCSRDRWHHCWMFLFNESPTQRPSIQGCPLCQQTQRLAGHHRHSCQNNSFRLCGNSYLDDLIL